MISLIEKTALNKMSGILYDFLPGQAHPFANQSISFAGVAIDLGLHSFWTGGSKKPAILALLENTYSNKKEKFCVLIVEIVNIAIFICVNTVKSGSLKECKPIL